MRNRFDRQLEQLHVELMEMGSMCEEVIRKTSRVLETGEKEMAKDIRKEDARIDEQERLIESLCLKLLLQQQPVAKDLRKVSAALKMITDMERIGDQASDIAEIVETGKLVASQQQTKLAQMAETTINMVTGSVDAYIRVTVTKYWADGKGKTTDLDASNIQLGLNSADWIQAESLFEGNSNETEVYYYKYPVPAGQSTSELLETIGIPSSLNNDYAGMTVKLEAVADGVQFAGADAADLNASGILASWGVVAELDANGNLVSVTE